MSKPTYEELQSQNASLKAEIEKLKNRVSLLSVSANTIREAYDKGLNAELLDAKETLEAEVKSWKEIYLEDEVTIKTLTEQNLKMREALEWYANDKNWNEQGAAVEYKREPNTENGPGETIEDADLGYRAEKALESLPIPKSLEIQKMKDGVVEAAENILADRSWEAFQSLKEALSNLVKAKEL